MPAKLSIHVSRVNAMRIIAAAIREKTKRFNDAKKRSPKNLERYRKQAVACLYQHLRTVRTLKTLEQCSALAGADVVAWQIRKNWDLKQPELDVCNLQNYLVALQNDVRKEIVVPMSSELWTLLQADKCEVKRA